MAVRTIRARTTITGRTAAEFTAGTTTADVPTMAITQPTITGLRITDGLTIRGRLQLRMRGDGAERRGTATTVPPTTNRIPCTRRQHSG